MLSNTARKIMVYGVKRSGTRSLVSLMRCLGYEPCVFSDFLQRSQDSLTLCSDIHSDHGEVFWDKHGIDCAAMITPLRHPIDNLFSAAKGHGDNYLEKLADPSWQSAWIDQWDKLIQARIRLEASGTDGMFFPIDAGIPRRLLVDKVLAFTKVTKYDTVKVKDFTDGWPQVGKHVITLPEEAQFKTGKLKLKFPLLKESVEFYNKAVTDLKGSLNVN